MVFPELWAHIMLLVFGVTAILLLIIVIVLIRRKSSAERELYSKTELLNDELSISGESVKKIKDDLESVKEKLKDSEKLASIGQLTAGIAHEINNPLNFINACIEPLIEDFNDLRELIFRYGQLKLVEDKESLLNEINEFESKIEASYL